MEYKEKLENLISKHGGIISAKELNNAGIPRQYLSILKNENKIENIYRGIYVSNEVFEDTMYCLQLRSPKIVFSHDTALYIHGLNDRDPLFYTITLPRGYNTKRLKSEKTKIYTVKEELYTLGLTTGTTNFGRQISLYDKERTICDVVKNRNNMDKFVFNDAIKRYVKSSKKDISKLMNYAKQFRLDKIIHNLMEVLL